MINNVMINSAGTYFGGTEKTPHRHTNPNTTLKNQ